MGVAAAVVVAFIGWNFVWFMDRYLYLDMQATVATIAILTRTSPLTVRDHHLFRDVIGLTQTASGLIIPISNPRA